MWFKLQRRQNETTSLVCFAGNHQYSVFGLRQSAEVVGDKLYIQRQKLSDALYGKSGAKELDSTLTCSPRGNGTQPNIEIFRVISSQRKPLFSFIA